MVFKNQNHRQNRFRSFSHPQLVFNAEIAVNFIGDFHLVGLIDFKAVQFGTYIRL